MGAAEMIAWSSTLVERRRKAQNSVLRPLLGSRAVTLHLLSTIVAPRRERQAQHRPAPPTTHFSLRTSRARLRPTAIYGEA